VELFTPVNSEAANSLATALVASSQAPLLLLDGGLVVLGASASFCNAFALDPATIAGKPLAALGAGEWNVRQLNSLLLATVAGDAAIDAYEMDLVRDGRDTWRLVLNAHKLDYADAANVRIVLAATDVTAARLAEKLKDDLVREKQILLQELQHRVANSLQIIASVLLQSARKVQSEESRFHLNDAHHRVMSIATLQKQLATSRIGEVELRSYFADLCRSIGASMISDHDRISLTTNTDDSKASANVSVSLGLIVTELVINALKHAFPGHSQIGRIAVDYRAEGKAWTMTVKDDGVGMPADHASTKPGLGTGIVDALSKQLDATVSIENSEPGTKVSIVHQP
jgi:two-component sensor histidine kinase